MLQLLECCHVGLKLPQSKGSLSLFRRRVIVALYMSLRTVERSGANFVYNSTVNPSGPGDFPLCNVDIALMISFVEIGLAKYYPRSALGNSMVLNTLAELVLGWSVVDVGNCLFTSFIAISTVYRQKVSAGRVCGWLYSVVYRQKV